ncbi:extracellular matrix protein 1 isoform X1 [Erpetoichthys calabaricus]|uniref:Extracellular matrix protein 1b n=1 Tax=Erpetoichthys calabaricus TaxID=27687 RepID=A0A8C4S1D2_ERPCA|nr:extracellular matrix protein 1 isoform X1 [Erpetoichthys calabaricus]
MSQQGLHTLLILCCLRFTCASDSWDDMEQREVIPELPDIPDPFDDLLQRPLIPDLHGLFAVSTDNPKPNIKKKENPPALPRANGSPLRPDVPEISFPPGQPTVENMGNICQYRDHRPTYPPGSLPRTGFGHIYRQGTTINRLEAAFKQCCLTNDPLCCAHQMWKNSLDDYCEEESRIKTLQPPCCLQKEKQRWACFEKEAENPSYKPKNNGIQKSGKSRRMTSVPEVLSWNSTECDRQNDRLHPRGLMREPKYAEVLFPPANPTAENIFNICKLQMFRPRYKKCKVRSFPGWLERQVKAIKRIEAKFHKCCAGGKDTLLCAQTEWKAEIDSYCSEEFSIKTSRYPCCRKNGNLRYQCFQEEAPYPKYNKDVQIISLTNISSRTMKFVCGHHKILTKKFPVGILEESLKEKCCNMPDEERIACAKDQVQTLPQRLCAGEWSTWEDSKKCCINEKSKQSECIYGKKLDAVSIAYAEANLRKCEITK